MALERHSTQSELDNLCINTIRFLSIDAVQKANSGHPGLPMGCAPIAYVLWTRFLKYNPKNHNWFDRDRFLLSAGHGSMLLYSMLHLTGYELPLEEIKNFRQWGSKTPGHPERGVTPGVEVTTGPLGQGFANGVGMAIAEANLAARYNRPGHEIINHFTYALCSDGDLMEGVGSEAASLAGDLRLGKLIYFYDNNHVSLAASTDLSFTEDRAKRFQAYGWHTVSVEDGNDINAIDAAIREAQAEQDRPSLILVRTHIGYGSPNKQDTFEVHGSPLGEEEVKLTKENLGWPLEPLFYEPAEALAKFREAVDRGKAAEEEWNNRYADYISAYPDLACDLQRMIFGALPRDWDADFPEFTTDAKGVSTRVASGKIMNAFAKRLPEFIGGSADLNPSTMTALTGLGDFQSPQTKQGQEVQGEVGGGWDYAGRNLAFGVREHAMAGICNGIAAHGALVPFAATFFIFTDYMRPPMRLAALSDLRVIYVLTHDSIGLGEDGPTHEPVEHLAGLRAMPYMVVIRPCDANETAEAWRVAIETLDRPVALILTRQNVPTLDRTQYAAADGLRKGAYILSEASSASSTPAQDPMPAGTMKGTTTDGPGLDTILIATGSEVHLAVMAQQKLAEDGIRARVVSIPSWELFNNQSQEYRESVLPPSAKCRLAIEAGAKVGWREYVGDSGDTLTLDHFGASAPGKVLFEQFGFTVENICARVRKLLEANGEEQ